MSNKIVSMMTSSSIENLKQIKGKDITDMKLYPVGLPEEKNNCQYNMALSVGLFLEHTEIVIASSPFKTVENEEFPRLEVKHTFEYEGECKEELTGLKESLGHDWAKQSVKSVEILHYKIQWVEDPQHNWSIDADIGLFIAFDTGYQTLIIARDSSIGVLDVYYGTKFDWIQSRNNVLDTYYIGENNVIDVKRNIMRL
ncbi:hypothetical protein GXN76_00825 [Kroppenstedtia pulmonis]|uniref:Uncharacterized protein n=1 Tax=Kroppenstedtia pulmonis TaxID=1380685 RepID=A0A7D3Y2W5_9BACL|nr:hypothetical protein [Kroppenstedtia pulmonis]QKG83145.1 hypothetical protein GXN76_00825 [Kroppenstedtia pulmonis]